MQNGFFLLEALIGILIFSLGLLGLVAMSGAAISAQSDAQYRAEAAKFANEIIGVMWVSADRANAYKDPTNAVTSASLQNFIHQPSGADCEYSGTAGSHSAVTAWTTRALATGINGGLPGASAARQQILISNTAIGLNKVTVTVCWQAPQDKAPRKHIAVAYIN